LLLGVQLESLVKSSNITIAPKVLTTQAGEVNSFDKHSRSSYLCMVEVDVFCQKLRHEMVNEIVESRSRGTEAEPAGLAKEALKRL
jgi:hypothetical protein